MGKRVGAMVRSPFFWLLAFFLLHSFLIDNEAVPSLEPLGVAAFVLAPLWTLALARTRGERLAALACCAATWALLFLALRYGLRAFASAGAGACLTLWFAWALWRRGELTCERAAALVLIAAFALRFAYTLGTPSTLRQHDVDGHINYMRYIVENGGRPPFLDMDPRSHWQFYHPPLHHLLSAAWIRIQMLLGATFEQGVEAVQQLSLLYSGISLVLCYRLFRALRVRGGGLVLACAMVGFAPILLFNAAAINNDPLLYVLEMALLYNAVRWWQEGCRVWRCALLGALMGLSMATKLSGALMAVPLGLMFLAALCKRRAPLGALWKQYALFLLISVPLGCAVPVYNCVRWGVPLNYVQALKETSNQYISGYTPLQRLFGLGAAQLRNIFLGLYGPDKDYNVFLSLFKTICFDEFTIVSSGSRLRWRIVIPLGVYVSCLGVTALSVVSMVRAAVAYVRRRALRMEWLLLGVAFAVLMLSYVKFCFDYPFVCTMQARYVLPCLPIAAACAGRGKPGKARAGFATAMCAFSAMMFVMLCLVNDLG